MDQRQPVERAVVVEAGNEQRAVVEDVEVGGTVVGIVAALGDELVEVVEALVVAHVNHHAAVAVHDRLGALRSEEHKSELQSLMRNSYAVCCLKKKHIRQTERKHP